MNQITEQAVLDQLKNIKDPDLRKDIVSLGFIKDLQIAGGDVSFRIVLTTPACPVKEAFETEAKQLVGAIEGVENVRVIMDAEVPKGRGIANIKSRAALIEADVFWTRSESGGTIFSLAKK